MLTKLDIWNAALQRLGADTAASEYDTGTTSNLCRRYYDMSLNQLLRIFPFSFALKRKELASEAAAPVYGYAFSFPLPNDFISLQEVQDHKEYVIESGRILSDISECRILYVSSNCDISRMTSDIAECLILLLASKMAFALTNNPSISQSLLDEFYKIALPSARAAELRDEKRIPANNSWIDGQSTNGWLDE